METMKVMKVMIVIPIDFDRAIRQARHPGFDPDQEQLVPLPSSSMVAVPNVFEEAPLLHPRLHLLRDHRNRSSTLDLSIHQKHCSCCTF